MARSHNADILSIKFSKGGYIARENIINFSTKNEIRLSKKSITPSEIKNAAKVFIFNAASVTYTSSDYIIRLFDIHIQAFQNKGAPNNIPKWHHERRSIMNPIGEWIVLIVFFIPVFISRPMLKGRSQLWLLLPFFLSWLGMLALFMIFSLDNKQPEN